MEMKKVILGNCGNSAGGFGRGKKRKRMLPAFLCAVFLLGFLGGSLCPLQVVAAEGAVRFGSESYTWNTGEVSPLGVYFEGSVGVGSFSICLEYDADMLEYLDGADRAEGNRLWIEGGGGENGYKRMLHFRPLAEGETAVHMVSASGMGAAAGEDGTVTEEEFGIAQLAQAPITVRKKVSSYLRSLKVRDAGDAIAGGGYYDIGEFSSGTLEYHLQVPYRTERLEIEYETEDGEAGVSLSDTALKEGGNEITLTVEGAGSETRVYTLYVERERRKEGDGGRPEAGAAGEAAGAENREGTEGTAGAENREGTEWTAGAGNGEGEAETDGTENRKENADSSREGTGNGSSAGREGEEKAAEEKKAPREPKAGKELEPPLFAALIAVGAMTVLYLLSLLQGRKKKAPAAAGRRKKDEMFQLINLEQTVIHVRHVTMNFRLAQEEASSLKEYLIRALKGQNHYRTFPALKDVSFEVSQGEVLGIVGTNGSGKSTLLKIIAGALLPSKGEVIVDKRKVQILTLGTGFDMELTARENVYLNGAIIGYSKEYIDEKFKDIVAFAELEGFMDERMKNFSSGMVSRLGFAIATMRDSPDILILDEVLSVGDMFFRKKSEKRIREMIHSGATVLIVSHSADVIRKNCDRAVWIEKGELQMDGKPEEVCRAYERMEKRQSE